MIEKVTNINQAIGILIQGVDLAQKRGAYSLEDASAISDAKDFILAMSKTTQESKIQPKENEITEQAESEQIESEQIESEQIELEQLEIPE